MEVNTDFTSDCPGFWKVYENYVAKHLEMLSNHQTYKCPFIDPDSESKILQQAHEKAWSKTLPGSQERMLLKRKKESNGYVLEWNGHRYGSDIIVTSFIVYVGCDDWQEKNQNMFKHEIENVKEFYRNIGSFTIFPKHKDSINCVRGRYNSKIYDRIDLTLDCIRKCYNHQDNPLYTVFVKDKEFFDLFKNFAGYVDFFCFQDLVSDGHVRDLMRGGFVDEESFASPLPKNVDEYEQWMKNQLQFVQARTEKIVKCNN